MRIASWLSVICALAAMPLLSLAEEPKPTMKLSPAIARFLDETNTGYELDTSGKFRLLCLGDQADNVLEKLKPLDALTALQTSVKNDLTSAGIKHLVQAKNLKQIHIYFSKRPECFPPAAFAELKFLPHLQELLIGNYPGETNAAMEHIKNLGQLRELAIYNSNLTDAGLRSIARLQHLEKLSLSGNGVTKDGFRSIAKLSKLKRLYLDTAIDDDALKEICKVRELKTLYPDAQNITDAGIAHIRNLSKLEELGLEQSRITDKGLEVIASLPQLESLNIADTAISDKGISNLFGKPRLKLVIIRNTRVTRKGAYNLLKSLPHERALVVHESIREND